MHALRRTKLRKLAKVGLKKTRNSIHFRKENQEQFLAVLLKTHENQAKKKVLLRHKNGHMSFFCHNIFNFDHFSPSSSKSVSTAAALSPETVVSLLPKPTWGKGKGWQGAGSNMSAPGCRVNLVHQHLGLYSLITSRWRLRTELVVEAFKVAFSEFPWGQECRVQWQILWCWGTDNHCMKFRGLLRKMIFIYSPVSCLIWWGEEGMLFVLGSPVLAEWVHPSFDFYPLVVMSWDFFFLRTVPAQTSRDETQE